MVFQNNPSPALQLKLNKAKRELDLFLTESADKTPKRSRDNYYIKSNKPNTLLAHRLKSFHKPTKPLHLNWPETDISMTQWRYSKSLDHTWLPYIHLIVRWIPPKQTISFLFVSLPTLSQSQLETLEGPISAIEVSNAIKTLKSNKRPGTDGFSALYFPVLANAFNALLKRHSFRQETLTAIICMLPQTSNW